MSVAPCRVCREDTTRLSRICVDCQKKTRKQRNKAVAAGRNECVSLEELARDLPDGDVARVARWFERRPDLELEVGIAAEDLRRRCATYGLRLGQWMKLVMLQQGRCGICKRERPPLSFCIDHDHHTGKVRGLLCTSCNTGLGLLGIDGPGSRNRAEAVVAYVRAATSIDQTIRTVDRPDEDVAWLPADEWNWMVDHFATPETPGTTFEERQGMVGQIWRDMGFRPESERPVTT